MSPFEERCLANKTTPEYQRELDQKAMDSVGKLLMATPILGFGDSIRTENVKLKEALATCACSLDSMGGLDSRNQFHRDHARAAIRTAMGA